MSSQLVNRLEKFHQFHTEKCSRINYYEVEVSRGVSPSYVNNGSYCSVVLGNGSNLILIRR